MAVSFDIAGLSSLAARFARAGAVTVERTHALVLTSAEEVARIAQAHVLVDTGALRHAIGFDIDPDGMGASIGPDTRAETSTFGGHGQDGGRAGSNTEAHGYVDYGPYVEYGTRAHVIRARNGGLLAFQGEAGPVFAREVQHPGTAAHPFMGPARDHVYPQFVAALAAIGAESL